MKELEGKTVKRLFVNDSQDELVFDCVDGLLSFSVVGDCCSSSYFNDVLNTDALFDATVNEVVEKDLHDRDIESRTTNASHSTATR